MTLRETLQKLATEKNSPCISISLNTHRTKPDNQKDSLELKNLLNEAKRRVEEEFGKRSSAEVLSKLDAVEGKIDHQHNLESLHIFISKDTEEIVKSTWPVHQNTVNVDDVFAVRPLIKAYARSEEYLILVLSQNSARLFNAVNDSVVDEVKNAVFPFGENPNIIAATRRSDSAYVDSQTKEYFRDIDKATLDYIRNQDVDLKVIVISNRDNFDQLKSVASKPQIYAGHDNKDYNNKEGHHLSSQAWDIIKSQQKELRAEAISEVKKAVSKAQVLTDLQEIYRAAIDGKGDVLVINQDFERPVKMIDERTFEYAQDSKEPGVLDDIVSTIAWEVMSKKGTVHFTAQEELNELGEIVLKTRF